MGLERGLFYLLTLGALATLGGAGLAQEVGDAVAGHDLATRECSVCHIVGPDAVGGNLFVGAPTFMEVAADPAVTELALRVFLQSPHETMPSLILAESEIDDLARYILSLRQR